MPIFLVILIVLFVVRAVFIAAAKESERADSERVDERPEYPTWHPMQVETDQYMISHYVKFSTPDEDGSREYDLDAFFERYGRPPVPDRMANKYLNALQAHLEQQQRGEDAEPDFRPDPHHDGASEEMVSYVVKNGEPPEDKAGFVAYWMRFHEQREKTAAMEEPGFGRTDSGEFVGVQEPPSATRVQPVQDGGWQPRADGPGKGEEDLYDFYKSVQRRNESQS